jgi:dephospho-CoA kinase
MSAEKFEAILKLQTPDADKRKLADYVIDTGVTIDETRAQVEAVYREILSSIS